MPRAVWGAAQRAGPGLLVACALALVAVGIERGLGAIGVVGVSAVFVAIVLGLLARQVVPADRLVAGARVAGGTVLRAGIVLLGVRFGLSDLRAVGGPGALVIGAALLAALLVSVVVLRLRLLPRRLAVLIAVGTAICGNSAIAATAPVLGADDEEVSYASATITLFGMVLVLVLPLVGQALGLGNQQFGFLAGAGVHDSAQAIAAGFIYSPASGEIAVVTKLARTMTLIPLVVLLSVAVGRERRSGSGDVRRLVPWFAVGFVALSLVRTGVEALGWTGAGWRWSFDLLSDAATACILVAMAGIGLSSRFANLRELGARPLVVGLVSAVAVTTAAGVAAVTVG